MGEGEEHRDRKKDRQNDVVDVVVAVIDNLTMPAASKS